MRRADDSPGHADRLRAASGKTRLGLQVAANLREDFRRGRVFCRPGADYVIPIWSAALIAQTLEVCGRRGGQSLLENLKNELSPHKDMLLLLDNFEHVVVARTAGGHCWPTLRG